MGHVLGEQVISRDLARESDLQLKQVYVQSPPAQTADHNPLHNPDTIKQEVKTTVSDNMVSALTDTF